MPYEFKMTHRVEFADTDMAGIMHFANFFRFMEVTEHAFLRSLSLSVHTEEGGHTIGWPRVRAACEYKLPLRFEDQVEVHLLVREKKERSLTYDFVFRKLDNGAASEAARGSLTVVCVSLDREAGTMKAVPIPAVFADRIEVAVEA
jgi:YbgC/YbaW family acyl-CoA thioester hydrolase